MHLTPNMYKNITLKANAKENAFDTKNVTLNVQKHYFHFEGKCKENRYLKMHVAPHMCKTVTLKANAKEIVTLKCI